LPAKDESLIGKLLANLYIIRVVAKPTGLSLIALVAKIHRKRPTLLAY